MIEREKRVLLRHYLEQGMSKAEIARQLEISRRTVYNWIEAGELDRGADSKAVRYGPRPRRPSKLDPYKGIIDARLAEYPKLSAVRLFNEVRAAGFGGGYGRVKRYVREVRPREPVEPVRRFETAPGHQGQVDFADFRLPWGKRHALIVVLGYSRRMWLRFHERQTMPVVMRGLEASFAYFGGVPSELLFDQMKAVITGDKRDEGRTADREPGVPALQPPLALPDPRMPSVPGPDEGEGRAAGPLYPGQLLLRSGVRVRRRPQHADPAVARWRGERSDPRYAEGARGGPVRPREAKLESPGSLALPSRGAAARVLDDTD
ncbi:MAG: IS21 family transposase [Gammaproteobacteria bacterium]|nr:IS21 family transposase [Gammaproteobacteria bacterium]